MKPFLAFIKPKSLYGRIQNQSLFALRVWLGFLLLLLFLIMADFTYTIAMGLFHKTDLSFWDVYDDTLGFAGILYFLFLFRQAYALKSKQ